MSIKNNLGEYLSYPKLLGKILSANRGIKVNKLSYGNEKNQYLLSFLPEKEDKETVIVYIHGGGWRHGSPKGFKYIGQEFAQLGYRTVLLGYRHAPKYKYPLIAEDIFLGLNKYIELQKTKGRSVENVVVVGSSAGAHLGAVLVYERNLQKKYNIKQEIFTGFIALGGPIVFDVCKNRTITKLLKGLFPNDYDRKKADPYYLLKGDEDIRVLCIHAKRDPICEMENSVCFTNKIISGLAQCNIVEDKNMFHSNLVAGIFLYDLPITNLLYNWIEEVQNRKS